jgi:hypothetical protein
VPGSCLYGEEENDVSRLTGLFAASAGGNRGAPGDDSPCPVNC